MQDRVRDYKSRNRIENMNPLQYLIDCEDSSLCVIHTKSLRNEENVDDVDVGKEVQFVWPEEDSEIQEIWGGTILEKSHDERKLLKMLKEEYRRRIKESRRQKVNQRKKNNKTKFTKPQNDPIRNDEDSVIPSKQKQKKRINTIQDHEILEKLRAASTGPEESYPEPSQTESNISPRRLNVPEFHKLIERSVSKITGKLENTEEILRLLRELREKIISLRGSMNLRASDYQNRDQNTLIPSSVSEKCGTPDVATDLDGVWTLKYTGTDGGKNQELIQGSNIFVNSYDLGVLLSNAKNANSLGRGVMELVFTKKALETCSLTGRAAGGYKPKGYKKRPGLHDGARNAIICYVRHQAVSAGWPVDDSKMLASMRNKLTEIRDTVLANNALSKYSP